MALGLGAGASGREGQIGGEQIFSDQALPALPVEFWSSRELARAPDLARHACTQAFAEKFDLEPWYLSQAEVMRLKASYDAHSDTPDFDPSPPAVAARGLSEDLSSERGATPRASSELFEDVKSTPKSKGKKKGKPKARPAAEGSSSDEDAEGTPKSKGQDEPQQERKETRGTKPHVHGALATALATSRAPPAPGSRAGPGSVAKSVFDAQAVARIQGEANRALREAHHTWPLLLEALEFDVEDAATSRQPPLVNAELATYLDLQTQGLCFIRHAAEEYALPGAPGGPGLVAALGEETAD